MNSDQLKGKWKQLKGKIKQKWADLTDDEIQKAEGDLDLLTGSLQERYGYTKEQARRELKELQSKRAS